MPMIGNSPRARSEGWIRMPWIDPEIWTPARPWMLVTLADRVSTKSPGLLVTSAHSMPIASIRIGMNDGNLNASPVADPTERNTPKPWSVTKVPSPRNPKLRASPPITREAMDTRAPTDWNEIIRLVVPAAPVSSRKSRALSVT